METSADVRNCINAERWLGSLSQSGLTKIVWDWGFAPVYWPVTQVIKEAGGILWWLNGSIPVGTGAI